MPPAARFRPVLLLCTAFLACALADSARATEDAAARKSVLAAQTNVEMPPHPKEIEVEIATDPFHIDRLFPSMRGPLTTRQVFVGDTFIPELIWLTGYKVEMVGADGETPESMDFECHTNLDWSHKRRPRWSKRPKPRIFTLTQGQTDVRLPTGFGLPMLSNEKLTFNSQVLNLNEPVIDRKIIHRAHVRYVRERDLREPMKPLIAVGIQGLVTLEDEARVWNVESPDAHVEGASCHVGDYAGERKERVFKDRFGRRFTPHWVLPPGRHEFRTLVTVEMAVPYDTTIHFVGVHVHPHSKSLELRDLTTGETVFKSFQQNRSGRLGLVQADYFSSETGIPVHKDHQYELISIYDNPTDQDSDAMAGMFLYYLDKRFTLPLIRSQAVGGDQKGPGRL